MFLALHCQLVPLELHFLIVIGLTGVANLSLWLLRFHGWNFIYWPEGKWSSTKGDSELLFLLTLSATTTELNFSGPAISLKFPANAFCQIPRFEFYHFQIPLESFIISSRFQSMCYFKPRVSWQPSDISESLSPSLPESCFLYLNNA